MRDHLFDQMEATQRVHFWFRARARIVLRLLKPLLKPGMRVMDAGCGTGLLLSQLPGNLQLAGLDPSPKALEHAGRLLGQGADLRQGSLPGEIPFDESSQDLILLTDVLEHIKEDRATLQALYRRLKPGGRLLLTVPAFSFLWSHHDEEHEHFRRYTKGELNQLLKDAGFKLDYSSYYNSLLFPLVLGIRLLKKVFGDKGGDMDLPAAPVNSILYHIFSLERLWIGRLAMPLGVSLIVLARRPE
jgi:SAM-dependent methyltransferase